MLYNQSIFSFYQDKLMFVSMEPEQFQRDCALIRLGDVGHNGDTMAVFEGKSIGVYGGIPGELVEVDIFRYRRRKKDFIAGRVMRVIEPSEHRIPAPCPYFGACSGCQWQHIDYSFQLELKRQLIKSSFKSYGGLRNIQIFDPLPSPDKFGYRNHARFTVRFGGQLGFSNRITRQFVSIQNCEIMAPGINDVLSELQGKCGETTNLSVRVGISTGDKLIQPTLKSSLISTITGQKWYLEEIKGRTFRVASPSFFQVNTKQAENLIDLVGDSLNVSDIDVLVDAYAGVGIFASTLARRAKKVIAIEESHSAVEDASEACADIENLEYIEGKTEDVLSELEDDVDALILDPPRVGCHPAALEAVLNKKPQKIAYVSCDPESLARDLDILVIGGYTVQGISPVDMFPQTYHVECVATLNLEQKKN